jgi:hypothetical protein
MFFKPRSFMINQMSCNKSVGWHRTTVCVMAVDAAVAHRDPLADLVDKVRFGDDAGQHVTATAYDNEIGMGFTHKFRNVDEWRISSDRDEPLACGR